jgi:hypothetical protein
MALRDYQITEDELNDYGLILKEYLVDNSVGAEIEKAYQMLITRIFELNHDIQSQDDIDDTLDTLEKQDDFRYAQFLILYAVCMTNENPVTQEVDSVIANRLRLKKVNGYQK